MEAKLLEVLNKEGLLTKKFVLAISGGVDSTVLFYLMTRIIPAKQLIVCHLNHGLRKESDKEADFVKEMAQRNNIPFVEKKLNLKNASEELARKKRYQYLEQIRSKEGFDCIVTAHHLNDQIETLLLKLTRGAGPLELWGMNQREGFVLRPFLDIPKQEIVHYAKANKLKWCEDKSNTDTAYARNRIRAKVIPELEKINPKFLETAFSTIRLGRQSTDIINKEVRKALRKVVMSDEILLKPFLKLPLFIQKEVIRTMLHKMTSKEGVYQKNIEEVMKLAFLTGEKSTKIKGYTITKTYDKIVFGSKPMNGQKRIRLGQKPVSYNGFLIKKLNGEKKSMKNNILLPTDSPYNLTIRAWESGDRIKTNIGTKKLQDVFTDAKVPKSQRKLWPIVVMNNEIVWVPLLAKANLKKSKNNLTLEVEDER